MTRLDFFKEFMFLLAKEKEKGHLSNKESDEILDFLEEYVADLEEDGQSQEEIFAHLGSPAQVLERVLQEKSVSGRQESEPFMEKEEQDKAETKMQYPKIVRTFPKDNVQRIVAQDSNCRISVQVGPTLQVEYRDNAEGNYTVQMVGSELHIHFTPVYVMNIWKHLISSAFREVRVLQITVPFSWKGDLDLRSSNGGIVCQGNLNQPLHVKQISLYTSNAFITLASLQAEGEIKLETSNASISLNALIAQQKIYAQTSNGKILAERLQASEMTLKSRNGRVEVRDICSVLDCNFITGNGRIFLENVQTQGRLSAKNENGKIEGKALYAEKGLSFLTTNASIQVTLRGGVEDYAIESHTTNGKNYLPNGTDGKIPLIVRTTNGSIDFTFMR